MAKLKAALRGLAWSHYTGMGGIGMAWAALAWHGRHWHGMGGIGMAWVPLGDTIELTSKRSLLDWIPDLQWNWTLHCNDVIEVGLEDEPE